ncbi:hypothetical protein L249_6734 [Ophiocordyceps polyrhachis-furcata BCC 54312]|uniref:Acid phosphatase n=1 Tax=Ophiocordyceps polyrhachis-furcata BCC 54312 TaxID=1330021 RepID=A0A367LKM6_9HYPO|nr:hypothetical protein L249_6734 [Ophiocordyceps polyrhachis-furcata BCC 54312]
MELVSLLLLLLLRHVSAAEERVLGVYIFHRHGDRSAKAWKPVNLTALGAVQVHSSGLFYRDRYIDANAPHRLPALSSDEVVASQISVTSPRDPVLQASALTFGQGLYPPQSGAAERLANGSRVVAPLGGYQFLPVDPSTAKTGDRPEDSAWLQGGTGCVNAEVSSNRYLASAEYHGDYDRSLEFYRSLLPVINGTYGEDEANFKNGYSIFDLINVATIHNATIPSSSLLTPSTRARLFQLASTHEWNLAYNVSEPIRAIAGSVLAGQVLDALRAIVDGKPGAPRFNAQFGAYATFMAFFGLARLPAASPDFYGICDYASSMVFELVSKKEAVDKPGPDDISVRFLFANGSAADEPLRPFPLFASDSPLTPWREFASAMGQFAITDTAHWCDVCGKTDGECAEANHRSASSSKSDANSNGSSSSDDAGRISKPVAGVIGALVTLVTIIGLLAAVMLLGGLRLVRKSSLRPDRRQGPDGAIDAKV